MFQAPPLPRLRPAMQIRPRPTGLQMGLILWNGDVQVGLEHHFT